MLVNVRSFVALLQIFALTLPSFAQQSPALPANEQNPVKIKTGEVLLDVIVQDKKGRPVRDLKATEIEVYEDGVKQTLTKFAVVGTVNPATDKAPATATADNGSANAGTLAPILVDAPPVNLVTLLFDHLSVQRVQAVREAGFNFVDNSLTKDMLVRVIVAGKKLYLLEQFTNDRAKLRKAVERATGTVEKSFADASQQLAEELKAIAAKDEQTPGNQPLNLADPKVLEAHLAKLSLDTLAASDKIAQETKSNLHVFSLLPLARAHRNLPGRKMALYFSDGLYLPDGMSEVLRTAISEANLANLSFYGINIRTLLAGAGNQVSRVETSTVVNQTRRPETATFNNGFADSFSVSDRYPTRSRISSNFSMFEANDRNRELNKRSPLLDLTENTGGFLITNSNDLNGALKRVGQELGNYYALSYQPSRQEYDGKFRAITVKVLRSGLKAHTRSGYFALPPSEEHRPVLSYETPLLSALHESVVPRDFAFQTGALHFEARANEIHCATLLELPLASLIPPSAQTQTTYPLSFAVLGLIKDETGEVVEKFSEPHQLEIPAAALEEAKKSSLTITRHFWLPPGKYTLETAAQDQKNNKLSGQRRVFVVKAPNKQASDGAPNGLQLGNLFLVKQVEKIDRQTNNDPENPLVVQDSKLTPDLSDTITPANRAELSFHLAIYPDAKVAAKPTLTLELLHEGQRVASTSPALPAADETGRINFTASVPTAGFVSGPYRFRAVVKQAQTTVEEVADFTVIGGRAPEKPVAEEAGITSTLSASDKVGQLTLQALKTVQPLELSPKTLIQEISQTGVQMFPRLGDYTYSLRKVRRVLTPKGKIKSEDYQDYEAYPIKGKHALIQLAENGSRLSLTRIDISRKTATDMLIKSEEERQSQSAAEAESVNLKTGYWGASLEGQVQKRGQARRNIFLTIDPEVLFQSCEFSAPRSLLLAGRETLVLNFRPRASAQLEQDKNWVQKLTGTVWIDAADRALVRIEAVQAASPEERSEIDENTLLNFVYQQQRLAAGVWAPSLIRINSGGDENLFGGLNWDAWFEFTNFKRFDASDTNVKLGAPDEKK